MNSSLVKRCNEGGALFFFIASFIGFGENQRQNYCKKFLPTVKLMLKLPPPSKYPPHGIGTLPFSN
jgi:hypothetical protein